MRWTPGGSSDDVEDRRDESGGGGFRPGGIHLGLGGIIVLFILSLIFKRDFLSLVSNGSMDTGGTTVSQPDPVRDQQMSLIDGGRNPVPDQGENAVSWN